MAGSLKKTGIFYHPGFGRPYGAALNNYPVTGIQDQVINVFDQLPNFQENSTMHPASA
jgi:hypothetical protein